MTTIGFGIILIGIMVAGIAGTRAAMHGTISKRLEEEQGYGDAAARHDSAQGAWDIVATFGALIFLSGVAVLFGVILNAVFG